MAKALSNLGLYPWRSNIEYNVRPEIGKVPTQRNMVPKLTLVYKAISAVYHCGAS
jgi:hypothetical protein